MPEVCRISLLSAFVVRLIDVFRFAGMGLYLDLFLLDPYAAWPPAVSACVFPHVGFIRSRMIVMHYYSSSLLFIWIGVTLMSYDPYLSRPLL
jgi:hypothetical protein